MNGRRVVPPDRVPRSHGFARAWVVGLTVMVLTASAPLTAQTQDPTDSSASGPAGADSAAIRATALDYIQGWYEGDVERMNRAIHPDLVKRIIRQQDGRSVLHQMGATELIEATRRGADRRTPHERGRAGVRILDIFGNTASLRVDAAAWVDYLHLARVEGEWRILNVLWELRPTMSRRPSASP